MKKRLWLLIIPIFLLGATFWVRDAAWKKTEADFRHGVKSWTAEVPTIHIYVQNSKQYPRLKDNSLWNTPDFLSTLDGIHLTRAQSRLATTQTWASKPDKEPLLFVSLNDGSTVSEPMGFYLSLKEDRGWIDIPIANGDDWTDNWRNKGYELAPQTCRDWKKHILALRENKDGELALPK